MNPTCPNCGSDELVYQDLGPLWYCRGCDSVLLEGEVEYDAPAGEYMTQEERETAWDHVFESPGSGYEE